MLCFSVLFAITAKEKAELKRSLEEQRYARHSIKWAGQVHTHIAGAAAGESSRVTLMTVFEKKAGFLRRSDVRMFPKTPLPAGKVRHCVHT